MSSLGSHSLAKCLAVLIALSVISADHLEDITQMSLKALNSNLGDSVKSLLEPLESNGELEAKSRQKRWIMELPKGLFFEMEWTLEFPFSAFTRYSNAFQFVWVLDKAYPAEFIYDTEHPTFHEQYLFKDEPHHEEEAYHHYLHRRKRAVAGRERRAIYQVAEEVLGEMGMPGRACLLRSVCELAETPFEEEDLIGAGLNRLLKPSLGHHDSPHYREFLLAESHGTSNGSCHLQYSDCQRSLFDSLPFVTHQLTE